MNMCVICSLSFVPEEVLLKKICPVQVTDRCHLCTSQLVSPELPAGSAITSSYCASATTLILTHTVLVRICSTHTTVHYMIHTPGASCCPHSKSHRDSTDSSSRRLSESEPDLALQSYAHGLYRCLLPF